MTSILAPERADVEALEDLTLQLNRAFRDLDASGAAIQIGDTDSEDLESFIRSTQAVNDNIYLLHDGSRAMTGDLNMDLNDIRLGQAAPGAHGALYGNVIGPGPSYHNIEWMPHYQAGVGFGWRIYDRDYVGSNPAGYMCISTVGGLAWVTIGPVLVASVAHMVQLYTNTLYEHTAGFGVTIDSMLVKDGHILLTALGGWVAQGDLIVGGAADYSILSIDTAGKILMSDGTDPGWTTTFTADMTFNAIIDLVATTAAAGQITQAGVRILHTYGTESVFLGADAGNFTLTGGTNVAVGYKALPALTSGNSNTAVGHKAGEDLTSNSYNSIYGASAGRNVRGARNTFVGAVAGFLAVWGNDCVCLGYAAGQYESGSSKLFIDNAPRANEGDGRIKALVYGEFAAATANQLFRVNGVLETAEHLEVAGIQVIGAQGAVVADADGTLASATSQLNALLARIRAHGAIAT